MSLTNELLREVYELEDNYKKISKIRISLAQMHKLFHEEDCLGYRGMNANVFTFRGIPLAPDDKIDKWEIVT